MLRELGERKINFGFPEVQFNFSHFAGNIVSVQNYLRKQLVPRHEGSQKAHEKNALKGKLITVQKHFEIRAYRGPSSIYGNGIR